MWKENGQTSIGRWKSETPTKVFFIQRNEYLCPTPLLGNSGSYRSTPEQSGCSYYGRITIITRAQPCWGPLRALPDNAWRIGLNWWEDGWPLLKLMIFSRREWEMRWGKESEGGKEIYKTAWLELLLLLPLWGVSRGRNDEWCRCSSGLLLVRMKKERLEEPSSSNVKKRRKKNKIVQTMQQQRKKQSLLLL